MRKKEEISAKIAWDEKYLIQRTECYYRFAVEDRRCDSAIAALADMNYYSGLLVGMRWSSREDG